MSRRKRPNWINTIALERMQILFVKLTRNISTKYNIPLPNYWRGRFCKNCNKFLKPGSNLRVRLSNNTISRKCLECGDLKKVPYTKKN